MKILIAIPVYNEELILEKNILKIFYFLKNNLDDNWQIVIADNNSTDRTGEIGKELENKFKEIKYIHIPQKGKGRAVRAAWAVSDADVYIFMDADLATDLSAFMPLVSAVTREGFDLVIGSRFHKNSKVKRSFSRKLVSLTYSLILRLMLDLKIKDAPCGFKAANHKIIKNIFPTVKNNECFFDTEMILLAEKEHYRIKEIPIIWTERGESDGDSKVNVLRVALNYLGEIFKLERAKKIYKFITVGFSSFIVNILGLYILVEIFFIHPSIASLIAGEIAIIWGFSWNNTWTFGERTIRRPLKIMRKFFIFNLTVAIGVIFFQTGAIQLGTTLFGQNLYLIYFLGGSALAIIWNFYIYDKVIWKR